MYVRVTEYLPWIENIVNRERLKKEKFSLGRYTYQPPCENITFHQLDTHPPKTIAFYFFFSFFNLSPSVNRKNGIQRSPVCFVKLFRSLNLAEMYELLSIEESSKLREVPLVYTRMTEYLPWIKI